MNEGRNAPRNRGANSPLAKARIAANMTQKQLADAVGCLQKDVSRWERGVVNPSGVNLLKLAEILGSDPKDLISLDE